MGEFNLCKNKVDHYCWRSQDCFLTFAKLCNSSEFGPSFPNGSSLYPYECLPAGAPILDHIHAYLKDDPHQPGGRSWLPWTQETLNLISCHRQVSFYGTLPKVETIVFGDSTEEEIENFIDKFETCLSSQQTPEKGYFPHSFYAWGIKYVTPYPDSAVCYLNHKGDQLSLPLNQRVPARVYFGFHDQRFDVIFKVKSSNFDQYSIFGDHEVDATTCVHPHFLNLFMNLPGIAVGRGIKEHLEELRWFLSTLFTYSDPTLELQLMPSSIDVVTLLKTVCWDSEETSLHGLNFLFTGGLVRGTWKASQQQGDWSTGTLTIPQDLYIQGEIISSLNICILGSLLWLINLCPTPLIAFLASGLYPRQFLRWFHAYQVDTLTASSPESPKPSAINPPVRAITHGGCSDLPAVLRHLCMSVIPFFNRKSLHPSLRWKPSSAHRVMSLLPPIGSDCGCKVGEVCVLCGLLFQVVFPDFLTSMKTPRQCLRKLLKDYLRTDQGLASKLQEFSLPMIQLLFAYHNPVVVTNLYLQGVKDESFRLLEQRDLNIMKGALISMSGEELPDLKYIKRKSVLSRHQLANFLSSKTPRSLDQDVSYPRRKKLRREVAVARRLLEVALELPAMDPVPPEVDELYDSDPDTVVPEGVTEALLDAPDTSDDEAILLINAPDGNFEDLLQSSKL